MRTPRPTAFLLSLALFGAGAFAGDALADAPTRLARQLTACSCNSGHGLHPPSACGGSYSRNVQRMYNENPGQMISCCRPRAVQDYLIKCFNRCGQPGRAVKNSRHVTGRACDTTNGSVGRRYGLAFVPHHGSNHWQD